MTRRALYDYTTGERIGWATPEQVVASDAAGESGVIVIDGDGNVRHQSDDVAVFGPLRTVYVEAED